MHMGGVCMHTAGWGGIHNPAHPPVCIHTPHPVCIHTEEYAYGAQICIHKEVLYMHTGREGVVVVVF